MKIACWSGPRNISTALMRSWSSRNDTFISDEPFYASYLKEKRIKHPMYKEIISTHQTSYKKVEKYLQNNIPNKNVSERVFSLITNKAKKRGNNRLKYDPNIASSPKKAEIL